MDDDLAAVVFDYGDTLMSFAYDDATQVRSLAMLLGHLGVTGVDGGQLFAIAGKITRLAPGGPAARQAAAGTPRIARRFFAANRGFQDYLAGRNRQLTSESKLQRPGRL